MNKNEWIATADIQTEDGQSWSLKYYVHSCAAGDGMTLYGMRIEKYNDAGLLTESETTPALTDSRTAVSNMAQAFAKGSVTPCVLLEMVDEYALPA